MFYFRFHASEARWTVWVAFANYNSKCRLPACLLELHSAVFLYALSVCMSSKPPGRTMTHPLRFIHVHFTGREQPATFLTGVYKVYMSSSNFIKMNMKG